MHATSATRLARAAVVASACAALTLTGAPAQAGPVASNDDVSSRLAPTRKIGPVNNLSLAITKPAASYRAAADWDALTGATSYKVTLTSATGTVIATTRTSEDSWAGSSALQVGTNVKVTVTPFDGKRPGRAASAVAAVPDLTAPTGSFSLQQTDYSVTVEQTALQDDLSAGGDITRSIDWDEGAGFEPWTSGTTATHTYPAGPKAYHPSVRLVDEAGNAAVVPLTAVAIDDFLAPTGGFTLTPTRAWAGYTWVSVVQEGTLSDDVSAPGDIARTVDWTDGTAATAWTKGQSLRHRFAAAGTFVPEVTLRDEAGHETVVTLPAVTVSRDTVDPRAVLTKPRVRKSSIRSWTPLRGKASDAKGTGVRTVRVRVVERRGDTWFAYRAPGKRWVKAASKGAALKKSRVAYVRPVANTWKYKVRGLRKGVLVVKVSARDNVGNVSTANTYRQRLTRR